MGKMEKSIEKIMDFMKEINAKVNRVETILDNDLNSIELKYKNSGRLSTRISPKIIKLSDNRVNVIFEIYEGSTVEVESINFVGNRSFISPIVRNPCSLPFSIRSLISFCLDFDKLLFGIDIFLFKSELLYH